MKLVEYDSKLNQMSFGKFREKELDLFFSICYKMKNLNTDTLELNFEELKELAKYDSRNMGRFVKDLSSIYDKILDLKGTIITEDTITRFVLFTSYQVNRKKKTISIATNEKYAYLLNDLKQFTKFELEEFTSLGSIYSKNLFKILKQYSNNNFKDKWWQVSMEEFRKLLGVPESYKLNDVNKRVLKPIITELPKHFYNLKVEKIKSGKKIATLRFSWEPSPKKKYSDIEVIAKMDEDILISNSLEKIIDKARRNIYINRFDLNIVHISELMKKYSEEDIIKGLNYAYKNINKSFKRLGYIEKTINSYLEVAGIERAIKKIRVSKSSEEKKKQEEKATDKLSIAKPNIESKDGNIIDRFNSLEEAIKNYIELQALEACVKSQNVTIDFFEKMKINSPAIYYNTLKPYIENLMIEYDD